MVHELGHVLGLSHYDDADHCDQLRDPTVDPLRDHFTAMSYRPRAGTAACETNGDITGRDLRDLYEAYHIGPLTRVTMHKEVQATSNGRVNATFYWGAQGAQELTHNAMHVVAQRKSELGWESVASTKAFDGDGNPEEMISVIHCGGIASEYRLVGASAFRVGLNAFTEDVTHSAPMAILPGDPPSTCGAVQGSSSGTQVATGDPAHVVGVAPWDGEDADDDWCQGKDGCPEVLSASIVPAYCFTGSVTPPITYSATGGGGNTPIVAIIGGYTPPPTLKGPPPLPQCRLTKGTDNFTVTARWGSGADDPSRSVSLPVQVVARPKPVKFAIAPSAAPGTCSPGGTVSIGWQLASDSGGPVMVHAHGQSSATSPLEVVCPPGVASGSSVEVWALRQDGGGRQVTATATQPLAVGGLGTTRDCVAGQATVTYFEVSGGSGPYGYTDQNGTSYTKTSAGSSWKYGYRCPSSFGPSELSITVTDGVGRTASAPLKLDVTCTLPLSAPSLPYSETGGISSSAIDLTWSEVCAESYRVSYSPADRDGNTTRETDHPPVTIDRLQPNTVYRFTVQALAQGASSPESTPASTKTAPPPPQAAVRFDAWAGAPGGPYSVLVSWPQADGAADYEAEIIDVSPGGPIDAAVVGTAGNKECAAPTDKRTRRFCDLTAAGIYEIGVEALNGDGEASDPGSAVACLGPCAVRVSGVTTSGLRLEWEGMRPGVL
ncbi:MAG: fibronectin type III domain-containing protein, partial [Chloroflexota bacterium]|nr:fibronectin type III domain-containing protein [Chloroflexota bacterium]